MTTNDETNYCDNLATDIPNAPFNITNTSILPSTNVEFKSLGDGNKTESNDRTQPITKPTQSTVRKKEVYKFETDWLISNVSWSNDDSYKLALTSYLEQYKNYAQIVCLIKDECDQDIKSICTFEHPYPATKILWSPQPSVNAFQLLATTADYLRLWRLDEDESLSSSPSIETNNSRVKLECLFNGNHAGPLTSFDWTDDASLIVTSSFDTTCTVWDVSAGKITSVFNSESTNQRETLKVGSQVRHVYDVAWSRQVTGREEIVLCRDDSIQLFDLRRPPNTIVLYEIDSQIGSTSLVRVSCSRQESNLVASFADNSGKLLVLDIRKAGQPLCVLDHQSSINSISWSPKSSKGVCSGTDDNQALIWQVPDESDHLNEPLLAYRANGKINAVNWAPSNMFIAIGYRNALELLRV